MLSKIYTVSAGCTIIQAQRWDSGKQLSIHLDGSVKNNTGTFASAVLPDSDYSAFAFEQLQSNADDDIEIHDAVSPNNDGRNDYFFIKNITNYPDNSVQVFNRWGIKVFETSNYDSNGNVFMGYSDERSTVSPDYFLPSSTYFYVVKYTKTINGSSNTIEKAGYLYLSRD